MYTSLLLPPSPHPTPSETHYHAHHLIKTKGTIYTLPPPLSILRQTYNAPPRPQSRMSSGAVALCKHFERLPSNRYKVRKGGQQLDETQIEDGEVGQDGQGGGGKRVAKREDEREPHPYWPVPKGGNEDKSRVAEEVLEKMLRECVWRNVMLLHKGVAVYEVRMGRGWGMRWTLHVVRGDAEGGERDWEVEGSGQDNEDQAEGWRILKTTFRGFLEPIEGLDHELDPG